MDVGDLIPPPNVKFRTDWPKLETLTLLQSCLKNKDLLLSRATQKIGQGWKKVVKSMWDQTFYYTKVNMKKRLTILIESYTVEDRTWPYYNAIGEYLGDEPEGSAELPKLITECAKQRQNNRKPTQNVATRGKLALDNKRICGVYTLDEQIVEELGDKFDYCKTLMLIDEYNKRKERFNDNITRSDTLYKEIESAFHAKGYNNIAAQHCSRRMAYLSSEFRRRYDMVTRLTGSGGDARRWDYYDVMSRLHEKSTLLEPRRLVALGSRSMNSVRVNYDDVVEKRNSRKRTCAPKDGKSTSIISLHEFRQQKLELGKRMVASAEKLANIAEQDDTYTAENDLLY